MNKLTNPIFLLIIDGWGIGNKNNKYNAIAKTATPKISKLITKYPSTNLICFGEYVGLPPNQMGNSEVGHLNIGAGRIVYQEFTRISKSIQNGDFFNNKILLDVIVSVKQANSALHLMGLLSNGGIHSHNTHLYALLKLAKLHNLSKVYIHVFLDGRDTSPQSGLNFINELENKIIEFGNGKIISLCGRYYAMDRDNRWERTKKAYNAIVYRKGKKVNSARQAIEQSYEKKIYDEFVLPTIIDIGFDCTIKENDGIIFFNFRADRARQLSRALTEYNFEKFKRRYNFSKLYYATMTQYDKNITTPIAFPQNHISNTLGEVFSKNGLKQLRIAETEKYAHVTYFFSGGREDSFIGEDRILVPSVNVSTYDLCPSMSAKILTDKTIKAICDMQYDFIVLNYANCDMVGHTGIFSAAQKAIITIDENIGRLTDVILSRGGIACITADHGNIEIMYDSKTDKPYTAHSKNDVPFILVSKKYKKYKLRSGILADIAPTILNLAGLKIPEEMTGKCLLNMEEL